MQNSFKSAAKDNGDWLSAQQAVRPDGTEVTNLPLVNKKLPPLVKPEDQLETQGVLTETDAEKK